MSKSKKSSDESQETPEAVQEQSQTTTETTSTGSAETVEFETKRDEGVLYLGIDLGTSRTSVTASNGVRETVASFVGYPKDVVSRKLLRRTCCSASEAARASDCR